METRVWLVVTSRSCWTRAAYHTDTQSTLVCWLEASRQKATATEHFKTLKVTGQMVTQPLTGLCCTPKCDNHTRSYYPLVHISLCNHSILHIHLLLSIRHSIFQVQAREQHNVQMCSTICTLTELAVDNHCTWARLGDGACVQIILSCNYRPHYCNSYMQRRALKSLSCGNKWDSPTSEVGGKWGESGTTNEFCIVDCSYLTVYTSISMYMSIQPLPIKLYWQVVTMLWIGE